jgi:hypothetical protein
MLKWSEYCRAYEACGLDSPDVEVVVVDVVDAVTSKGTRLYKDDQQLEENLLFRVDEIFRAHSQAEQWQRNSLQVLLLRKNFWIRLLEVSATRRFPKESKLITNG